MYKITATVIKPGGSPVAWTTFSTQKMTAVQCEKRFSGSREAGRSFEVKVVIEDFACAKVEAGTCMCLP